MSPLVLIVFVPVIVGAVAFVALLLGAATAGAWEVLGERPQENPSVVETTLPQTAETARAQARAA